MWVALAVGNGLYFSFSVFLVPLVAIIGRAGFGLAADRFGGPLAFGLGFGAKGPIITAMASDLFGGRRFGVIYGALSLGNGFGGAIGLWFGGVVHDVMGSYRVVFLSSVVFCALGSACFWLAQRRVP